MQNVKTIFKSVGICLVTKYTL